MIENVVVQNSPWTTNDLHILFPNETHLIHFTKARDLPNLLVELGVFPSTSKARQANREGKIPQGWTELKASKKRRLWIWNPNE